MVVLKRLLLILFVCSTGAADAQQALDEKPSPLSVIRMRFKDTYVKITYSQPHKRGRKIFGELVPYRQVWRTGANEATELTTTRDIMINNQLLKAGTYTLFTIPDVNSWTIVINADVGLWGAYNYNENLDVMRFDVPVEKVTGVIYEPFTMQFNQRNDVADLLIMWDDVSVSVPFKFVN